MTQLLMALALTAAPTRFATAVNVLCKSDAEAPLKAAWKTLTVDRGQATTQLLEGPETCEMSDLVFGLACGAKLVSPPTAAELSQIHAALLRQLSGRDAGRAQRAATAAHKAVLWLTCPTREKSVAALAPAVVNWVRALPHDEQCGALALLLPFGRAASGAVDLVGEFVNDPSCGQMPDLVVAFGPDALALLPKLLVSVGDGPDFNVERVGAIGSLGIGARSATPTLMRLLALNLKPGGEEYRAAAVARALAQLEAAGPPQPGVEAALLQCFSQPWDSESLLNAMLPLANTPGQVRERLLALMVDPRFKSATRIAFEVVDGPLSLTKEQRSIAAKLTKPRP